MYLISCPTDMTKKTRETQKIYILKIFQSQTGKEWGQMHPPACPSSVGKEGSCQAVRGMDKAEAFCLSLTCTPT
jgi:hypothetical protein